MRLSRPARSLCLALAATPLLLAGCGGNDAEPAADADVTPDTLAMATPAPGAAPSAAAPPAAQPDPCALLSPQEVQAATGVEAGTGQPSTSGGARVCTWTDASGKSALVQIHAGPHRYEESRQVFQQVYGAPAEPVVDLGEQAFYIGGMTASFPTGTVSALQRGTAISAQVMGAGLDAATLRSQTTDLARATLAKL